MTDSTNLNLDSRRQGRGAKGTEEAQLRRQDMVVCNIPCVIYVCIRQLIGYLEIRLVKCNKMVSVAARCTRTGNGELAVFGGKHTACEEEEEMPLSFRRSVCTYVFEKEQYCVERELMLLSAVGGAPRPTITANRSLLCARRRFLKEGRLLPAA